MEIIDHNGSVHFAGFTCVLCKSAYTVNDAPALYLIDAGDGAPVATVTANVPGISERLPEGEVLVKDFSENTGVMDALVEAGYLEPTGNDVPSGFAILTGARLVGPEVAPKG